MQDAEPLQRPRVGLVRLRGCHQFMCLRGHSSAAEQTFDPAALQSHGQRASYLLAGYC